MMKTTDKAEAIHIANGNQHIVGVKSLKVMLSKDGDAWFAQGLEIDYAAAGSSIEEAKKNFSGGLKKTIIEFLKLHGSIDKFLKPAENEAWTEYYKADPNVLMQKYTAIQFSDLSDQEDDKTYFPFKEIEFLELAA